MFQHRMALLVNSAFFERDLKKHHNRRCDYRKLLTFISGDEQQCAEENVSYPNNLNDEYKINDIVRAVYVHSQTVYNGEGLISRENDNHSRFLNALRNIGYQIVTAYNSADAHFVLMAEQLASSGAVDVMWMLGLTVDHVPLLNSIRSKGIFVGGFFGDTYEVSERIKGAVDWYHNIKVEDGFLGEPLKSHNVESETDTESK